MNNKNTTDQELLKELSKLKLFKFYKPTRKELKQFKAYYAGSDLKLCDAYDMFLFTIQRLPGQ